MKKIENTFAVTGFVGKDAEIRSFATASVARFSLAVSRQEKSGDQTNRVSSFMNFEAWRKNENTESFDCLTKGTLLTVEGYFKPEKWSDKDGVEHSSIAGAGKESKAKQEMTSCLPVKSGLRVAFFMLIAVLCELSPLYFTHAGPAVH